MLPGAIIQGDCVAEFCEVYREESLRKNIIYHTRDYYLHISTTWCPLYDVKHTFIAISVTIENAWWKVAIKLSVCQLICIQFDPTEQI